MKKSEEITSLLMNLDPNDATSIDKFIPLVFDDLRSRAQQLMQRERSGHTWEATDLVHEYFLYLRNAAPEEINNRKHFFAISTLVMKRLLIQHARGKAAHKRGGDLQRVDLEDAGRFMSEEKAHEILMINQALEKYRAIDPRGSQVLEYYLFFGFKQSEIADVMEISERTVRRDYRMALAWLKNYYANVGS